LEKMGAIYTINQEIIDRIQSKESFSSYSYHLEISVKTNRLELIEKEHKQDYAEFMEKYTIPKTPSLTVIEDLFKDNLNYNCRKFNDLCHLNTEMIKVAKQYLMFGGSQESIEVLELFKSNYEVLQVLLGDIEGKYTDIISYHEEFTEQVNRINETIMELEDTLKKRSYLSTKPFTSRWIIHRQPFKTISERTIETVRGQADCALAHTEWASPHEPVIWKVRIENWPKANCGGWFQFAIITSDMLESTNFYSTTSSIISDSEFYNLDTVEITMDLRTGTFSCDTKSYKLRLEDKRVALAVLVNYTSNNIPSGVRISRVDVRDTSLFDQ